MRASRMMLAAAAAALISGPAQSQGAQAYECQDSTSGDLYYVRFAPGLFQMRLRNGTWDNNYCDPSAFCGYEGDRYRAESDEGFFFTFRLSDGASEYSDMMGAGFAGLCRPYSGEPPRW